MGQLQGPQTNKQIHTQTDKRVYEYTNRLESSDHMYINTAS